MKESFCKLELKSCCLIYYSYTVVSSAVSIKYGLRTADCGLGIKYGLGIK